ncbi:hypothetical protein [Blastopirellula marina]|uniref:DUF3150 domain-containing protein n=1 Tax=Blastopirellula marina DSM 3645 TaxID=314230 RepID=A3ZSL5_9BACT|nr:hypothetical protein [Blastopirellula marina]EAQ80675.1 hypothetical protein DSM3645_15055 [Blastopirellula marina DSM 3645]
MSTLLENDQAESISTPARRLQATMAAARLSFTWFGVRKSLSTRQRDQAADSFGAEGKFLSAGKKLLDTSHPAFRAVTAIRGQAIHFWKGMSLPFPEPGVRLIRQDAITHFDERIAQFQEDLGDAVVELEGRYDELRQAARERLGELYSAEDYPPTVVGMFEIDHDYPSVEPPHYLRQLCPELYEHECQRMQARFDDAVQLAEQAFFSELTHLVDHLTDRLSGQSDGKPKVFRDTAVTNLTEFFERFRLLNIRSSPQLDELVQRAQEIVVGVSPQQLRDSTNVRQQISAQLGAVQASLDGLLIDRPRRNILRRPR